MLKRALVLLLLLSLFSLSGWSIELEYLSDQNIKTGAELKQKSFGGISALAWRSAGSKRHLWALSDDRGTVAEPRLYRLAFDPELQSKEQLQLEPDEVLFLKLQEGKNFRKGAIDPEGLVFLDDGRLIITSEGDGNLKPRVAPQILIFNQKGVLEKEIQVPPYYNPEKSGFATQGIRNNGGFEGLGLFPDGKHILVGTEFPLVQDGKVSSSSEGGTVRILKYRVESKKEELVAEWIYPLEATRDFGAASKGIVQGLTEVFPLSEKKALVLERGLNLEKNGSRLSAQLYEVDLSSATNILGRESLSKGEKARPLEKKLILDFETTRSKLSEPKTVDNLEGMAWGPVLKDGRKTLIFISDNNFSKRQRTQIIYFAVVKE